MLCATAYSDVHAGILPGVLSRRNCERRYGLWDKAQQYREIVRQVGAICQSIPSAW